jgi:hypothetical protein
VHTAKQKIGERDSALRDCDMHQDALRKLAGKPQAAAQAPQVEAKL